MPEKLSESDSAIKRTVLAGFLTLVISIGMYELVPDIVPVEQSRADVLPNFNTPSTADNPLYSSDSIPAIPMPESFTYGGEGFRFSKEATNEYLHSTERNKILTGLFSGIANTILQNKDKIGYFDDYKPDTKEWSSSNPSLEGYVRTGHGKTYGGSENQYILGLQRDASGEYDINTLDFMFFSSGSTGVEGKVDDLHSVLIKRDQDNSWDISETYIDDYGKMVTLNTGTPVDGFTAEAYEKSLLLDEGHVLQYVNALLEANGIRTNLASSNLDGLEEGMPKRIQITA